jgi:ADP-ribosylglycohydrolase
MTDSLEDRVLGCIVGGAIGDAPGGPYEGQPGPVSLLTDAPCRLSDDTQLTLATCEAVRAEGAVSPASVADRFACWFRQGRVTGVGASTLKALRDLSAGVHWALSGRKGERGAGNGAAMRVAPLGFLLDPAPPRSGRSSVTSPALPTTMTKPTSARWRLSRRCVLLPLENGGRGRTCAAASRSIYCWASSEERSS